MPRDEPEMLNAALHGFKWEPYVQLRAEIPRFRLFKIGFGFGNGQTHEHKIDVSGIEKYGHVAFH